MITKYKTAQLFSLLFKKFDSLFNFLRQIIFNRLVNCEIKISAVGGNCGLMGFEE
jgi:hypothetical protein